MRGWPAPCHFRRCFYRPCVTGAIPGHFYRKGETSFCCCSNHVIITTSSCLSSFVLWSVSCFVFEGVLISTSPPPPKKGEIHWCWRESGMSNDPNDRSGCLHGTLCSGGQCSLARPLVDQLYPPVWPLGWLPCSCH